MENGSDLCTPAVQWVIASRAAVASSGGGGGVTGHATPQWNGHHGKVTNPSDAWCSPSGELC